MPQSRSDSFRSDNDHVRIKYQFSAPIQNVWQAWTDPKIIKHWFGSDPDGIVLNALIDLRTGGSFEVKFCDSDDTEHTCNGNYLEIKPLSKLRFSWSWKSEPGHTSFVSISFTSNQQGTQMNFEHSNLNAGSAHNYEEGWNRTFNKLEAISENQNSDKFPD